MVPEAARAAVVLTSPRRNFLLRSLALTVASRPLKILADQKGVPMQSADNSAALKAELRVAQNRLTLAYAVKNLTGAELFLFNRMYDDVDSDGRYRVGKDICNVEIRGGHVLLSKKIPAVPELTLVESPNLPCVTVLAAHSTFTEVIDLPLPLNRWTPYATMTQSTRRVLMPLVFELGYFVGRDGTRAMGKEVATTTGSALRFAPFSLQSQTLLRVGPFEPVAIYES